MTPRQPDAATRTSTDLFRERLDNMLNQRHALYRLADLIEWSVFDKEFGSLYCPDNGCPGKPTRLMVGLHYLKHCYGLSDEAVVSGWVENPYWQYVCGAVYFQHEAPVDPSSLTRCRQRIGVAGCARILQVTVALGVQSKAVKTTDFKRVTVDTTVQEISGELSDRQQVAESVPGAVGTVMSQTGGGVTPEHCPQGAAGVTTGKPLRPCQTVSATAARGEAVTHVSGPGGA